MNREEITKLAREAGFVGMDGDHGALRRFAVLVAAAEREACAKVCEAYTDNDGGKFIDHEGHGYECAAAIRARGQA